MLILALGIGEASAQKSGVKMIPSGKNAERMINADDLRNQVVMLSDSLKAGRATGSKGAVEAGFWIAGCFQADGLMKMGDSWSRSFMAGDAVGHNLVGFFPGKRMYTNEMYTIIAANYDSFGILDGVLYPGADSNASGVVAMLSLSDMFKKMKDLGRSYGRNIIFVALDAKFRNSAGARALWEDIENGRLADPISGKTILPRQIHSFVCLDILGSTLEPIHRGRKDYLIMMSGIQYKEDLKAANKEIGLDLGFDYYGSQRFTEMFYSKSGDQKVFIDNGILSVVFTSGVTMHTNKTSDTADTLRYEILKKRIFVIFHWLEKIL